MMPFKMDEYRRGARYSVARINNEVTTGAEGIELVESKEYVDEKTGLPGRYTKKVYHLESRVPGWVKLLAPSSALKLDEESWDAFPYCKTIITNRFFGERFSLTIESRHFDMDKGERENALELSEELLAKRVVSMVDIGADQPTDKNEYKESEDPRLVESKKHSERFKPLKEGWKEETETYMCCYKVVTILFKIWGVQGKGESFLMDMESQIFLKFHKEIFCWLDDWFGLSLDEIIATEKNFYDSMSDRLEAVDADGKPTKSKKKDKKSKKTSDSPSSSSASSSATSSAAPTPITSPIPGSSDSSEPSSRTSKRSKTTETDDVSSEATSETSESVESTPTTEKKSKKSKKATAPLEETIEVE